MNSSLEEVLHAIEASMNPEESQRRRAEEFFDQQTANNAPVFFTNLARVMSTAQRDPVRNLAIVLIRRRLCVSDPPNILKLPPDAQNFIRGALLNGITKEVQSKVRSQIVECAITLAIQLHPTDTPWIDFIPWALELYTQDITELKIHVLSILGQCCQYIMKQVGDNILPIMNVYKNALDHPDIKVQVAAIEAIANTIQALETEDSARFLPVMPKVIPILTNVLTRCANENNFSLADDYLATLIMMVETEPKLFVDGGSDFVKIMYQVGMQNNLPEDVPPLALEFLVQWAETSPTICRKIKTFIPCSTEICLNFMLHIEEYDEWTEEPYSPMLENDSSWLSIGCYALDRLTKALSGKAVVPTVLQLLRPKFWENPDYEYRHAALMAVTQLTESMENSDAVVQLGREALRYFEDGHPRVVYSAINAIAQMASDHGGPFQENIHGLYFPAIVKLLSNSKMPGKILAHGSASLVNFCEFCKAEMMEQYLDPLLRALFDRLRETTNRRVQEQFLTAIAALADSSKHLFKRYYEHFTPILNEIIHNATSAELSELRGRAVECVGFVGVAVGKEMFHKFGREVMQQMIQWMRGPSYPDMDEAFLGYVFGCWGKIASCLERDFIEHLEGVSHPLIYAATIDIEATQVTEYDEDYDEEENDQNFEMVIVRDEQWQINASKTQLKCTALQTLESIAEDVKQFYWPILFQTRDAVLELVSFPYSALVRRYAMNCLPRYTQCIIETLKSGIDQLDTSACTPAYLNAFYAQAVERLLAVMMSGGRGSKHAAAETLDKMLRIDPTLVSNNISPENVKTIIDSCFKCVQRSHQSLEVLYQRRREPHHDIIAEELLREEAESEGTLLVSIVYIVNALMKVFGSNILQFINTYSEVIGNMLIAKGDEGPVFHKCGAFLVDDVIENVEPPKTEPYVKTFAPVLMNQANDETDLSALQAEIFCLGMMVEKIGPFTPGVGELMIQLTPMVAQLCVTLILRNSQRYKMSTMETSLEYAVMDNILSTLVRCIIAVSSNSGANYMDFDRNACINVVLQHLPIKVDRGEAVFVHEYFVSLIQQNDGAIMTVENIQQLLRLLAACARTRHISSEKIANFTREFVANLKQQGLYDAHATMLSGDDQRALAS